MEVERSIDDLYQAWPGDFIAARAARAAEARKAKGAADSQRIARLRRPTLAAWASNRFVRERPPEVRQLLDLGKTLREAHRTLDADTLRKAGGEQHRVITRLAREAAALAHEAGHPLTQTVLHEVEQIFHAVLADPDVAAQWSTGRLVKAPEATVGFGPTRPQAASGRRPAGDKEARGRKRDEAQREQRGRLERARAAAEESAAEADRADGEFQSAREAQQAALEDVRGADQRVERLEEELRQAEAIQREARATAATAEERVAEARQKARKAHRTADTASRAVARLTG